MEKKIVAPMGPTDGFPGVVAAGPLLFVSGCDGHRDRRTGRIVPALAADAESQCENAYGQIEDLLGQAGADMASVVRLDHLTSSQDWLHRRQSVRGRIFGKPAPLASTGIAGRLWGVNMLTSFVIAVSDAAAKEVLVPGPKYGMENISAAVRGGPLVFVSGIRGTIDPWDGAQIPEETPEAFGAQARVCYRVIEAILCECGLAPESILRIDCYLRDASRAGEDDSIRREVLGPVACATTRVALPLSARGELEVTVLAADEGVAKEVALREADLPLVTKAENLLFVGECLGLPGPPSAPLSRPLLGEREAQLHHALATLETCLRRCGSALSQVVRLELYLRDIYFAEAAAKLVRACFADDPPAIAVMGADLENLLEVKLNAIAVRSSAHPRPHEAPLIVATDRHRQ